MDNDASSGDNGRRKRPARPPGSAAAGAGSRPPGPPGKARPARPPATSRTGSPTGTSRKEFASDQDVRWCPGCGDYAILATVQRLLPELDVPREDVVFISGIGCSSRFPYYVNTFGVHSIHGRAPAIATGLKASRPELDIWIVTGDGDALSMGGNHLIHLLRRNLDVQLLLFNNQIYGLTKGQYSPTSEIGKVTKSTPYGSLDHPFNPVALALGADATFVARSMDRDPRHLRSILQSAHDHRGTSFVEIYQNCNIFNDGAFFAYTEKETKPASAIFAEHGKPLVYDEGRKGLRLDGFRLESVDLTGARWTIDDCLVHDETSPELASILGRLFFDASLPQPFGVFFRTQRPTYDTQIRAQLDTVTGTRGRGSVQSLLQSGDTWVIE